MRGSGGRKSPSGSRAKPGRGSGDEVPQKLKQFYSFRWKIYSNSDIIFRILTSDSDSNLESLFGVKRDWFPEAEALLHFEVANYM